MQNVPFAAEKSICLIVNQRENDISRCIDIAIAGIFGNNGDAFVERFGVNKLAGDDKGSGFIYIAVLSIGKADGCQSLRKMIAVRIFAIDDSCAGGIDEPPKVPFPYLSRHTCRHAFLSCCRNCNR